jgi:hypothetical protein
MKIERALAAFARSAQADRTKCDASGGHSRSGSALGIGQFAVIQSVAPTVALQPAPVGRRMVDHRGHFGIVVARAAFGGGRITYHRIVGAILLYLLIAVTFATLFAFVSLSISDAFKGIVFEDDSALASLLFYLSFVTLTSNRLRDIVPVHPWREVSAMSKASLVNSIRRRFWPGL